jgi:predicted RNase H-like nuclease (RuvC/YqgF family)
VARGRYKAKAEAQSTSASIKELEAQVSKLTEENKALKAQLDQNLQHHAFQIAQMHQHLTEGTAPEIVSLKEENLNLKRALRGD